ncbi:MAG: hypothetical protein ACREAE_03295 [Nitrosopumilaceae archaeon]
MKRIFSKVKGWLSNNSSEHGVVYCPACNTEVELYWDPEYNGVRGTCIKCGTNWAES